MSFVILASDFCVYSLFLPLLKFWNSNYVSHLHTEICILAVPSIFMYSLIVSNITAFMILVIYTGLQAIRGMCVHTTTTTPYLLI